MSVRRIRAGLFALGVALPAALARAQTQQVRPTVSPIRSSLREALGECVRNYPPGHDREVCVAAAMHTLPPPPPDATHSGP